MQQFSLKAKTEREQQKQKIICRNLEVEGKCKLGFYIVSRFL